MKRYTLSAALLLGVALSTSACDKGLADINDNPNAPTDVPAQYLLPNAIQQTVEFGGENTWITLEMTGIFVQHWAKIQYTEEDQYELRDGIINGLWDRMYSGPMKDWDTIIKKGQETADAGEPGKGNNQSAIGLIGKTYTVSLLTDLYGDVPYSQALQADAEESITAPVYDSQQAIYSQMLSDLATAVGMLDPSAASFTDADLLYGGDVNEWIRFANSLRLRLAMRISDKDPTTAQSVVEAVAAQPDQLILTNDDNAGLAYTTSSPYRNPLFENAATSLGGSGSRDDHAVSNSLVGILDRYGDPRIEVYANPAADQDSVFTASWCGGAGQFPCQVTYNGFVYRGERNGIANGVVPKLSLISRIGRHFRADPDTPQYLLTAAEVNFLLAEAALNGWIGGTAESYYEAGIREAFDLWNGVTVESTGAPVDLNGQVDAYIAQASVALTGNTTTDLEKIIDQKWLALYTMPWEAYAEYRRTGYPDELLPSEDAAIDYIPGRIPYPSMEQSLNSQNRKDAIANQAGNEGTYCGTLWWDPAPYPNTGGC